MIVHISFLHGATLKWCQIEYYTAVFHQHSLILISQIYQSINYFIEYYIFKLVIFNDFKKGIKSLLKFYVHVCIWHDKCALCFLGLQLTCIYYNICKATFHLLYTKHLFTKEFYSGFFLT